MAVLKRGSPLQPIINRQLMKRIFCLEFDLWKTRGLYKIEIIKLWNQLPDVFLRSVNLVETSREESLKECRRHMQCQLIGPTTTLRRLVIMHAQQVAPGPTHFTIHTRISLYLVTKKTNRWCSSQGLRIQWPIHKRHFHSCTVAVAAVMVTIPLCLSMTLSTLFPRLIPESTAAALRLMNSIVR